MATARACFIMLKLFNTSALNGSQAQRSALRLKNKLAAHFPETSDSRRFHHMHVSNEFREHHMLQLDAIYGIFYIFQDVIFGACDVSYVHLLSINMLIACTDS
jgi:hypothetical protein